MGDEPLRGSPVSRYVLDVALSEALCAMVEQSRVDLCGAEPRATVESRTAVEEDTGLTCCSRCTNQGTLLVGASEAEVS